MKYILFLISFFIENQLIFIIILEKIVSTFHPVFNTRRRRLRLRLWVVHRATPTVLWSSTRACWRRLRGLSLPRWRRLCRRRSRRVRRRSAASMSAATMAASSPGSPHTPTVSYAPTSPTYDIHCSIANLNITILLLIIITKIIITCSTIYIIIYFKFKHIITISLLISITIYCRT